MKVHLALADVELIPFDPNPTANLAGADEGAILAERRSSRVLCLTVP